MCKAVNSISISTQFINGRYQGFPGYPSSMVSPISYISHVINGHPIYINDRGGSMHKHREEKYTNIRRDSQKRGKNGQLEGLNQVKMFQRVIGPAQNIYQSHGLFTV